MQLMKGLDPQQQQQLILSVGTHRGERPLSPVEVAELIAQALASGASRKAVSEALGIGMTQVSTFLRLLGVDPAVRDLASWGSRDRGIAFSTVALLAQLPEEADHAKAASAILRHGLTWKEVVGLVQIRDRAGVEVEEAVGRTLAMRPVVETRHVLVGAVTSEAVRHQLQQTTQAERDDLVDRALQSLAPAHPTVGRLGTARFTIVSDEDSATVFGLEADELELRMNDALAELLT